MLCIWIGGILAQRYIKYALGHILLPYRKYLAFCLASFPRQIFRFHILSYLLVISSKSRSRHRPHIRPYFLVIFFSRISSSNSISRPCRHFRRLLWSKAGRCVIARNCCVTCDIYLIRASSSASDTYPGMLLLRCIHYVPCLSLGALHLAHSETPRMGKFCHNPMQPNR